MNNFVKMASSTDQHGSFYSPITKSGVQTFSDMAKKSKFQSGQIKITGSLSPEVILRSALSIASCRDDVSLESVLSHPVGLGSICHISRRWCNEEIHKGSVRTEIGRNRPEGDHASPASTGNQCVHKGWHERDTDATWRKL